MKQLVLILPLLTGCSALMPNTTLTVQEANVLQQENLRLEEEVQRQREELNALLASPTATQEQIDAKLSEIAATVGAVGDGYKEVLEKLDEVPDAVERDIEEFPLGWKDLGYAGVLALWHAWRNHTRGKDPRVANKHLGGGGDSA